MDFPKRPRIVWVPLGAGQGTGPVGPTDQGERAASLAALLAGPRADALVLEGGPEAVGPALQQLRSHPDYGLSLIYINGNPNALANPLVAALADGFPPQEHGTPGDRGMTGDGAMNGPGSSNNDAPQAREDTPPIGDSPIEAAWRHWLERLELFNRGARPDRFDHSLLCWLWLRPERWIEPVADPSRANFYRYPLVEAIAGEGTINPQRWLHQQAQDNLLEAGELLDRLRQCSACSSSRLNYVDVCPECHGLAIRRQPSLHCFVCGHVAPQQEFVRSTGLVCANCLSPMRHIGSDYDRPLENYRCDTCQAFFEDGLVVVRCLDYGHQHDPGELRVLEVHPYRLSGAGRLSCRQGLGERGLLAEYLQRLKVIPEHEFLAALDWQLAIARRYGQPKGTSTLTLLGLRLENLGSLLEDLGEPRSLALLDSLFERLEQEVRETDRCMRGGEDRLWILLPQTAAAGLHLLEERLVEGLDRMESPQSPRLQLRLVGCVLPDQLEPSEDATLLLARLGGELS